MQGPGTQALWAGGGGSLSRATWASEALGSPTRGPEGLAQEEPPHGSLPWGGAAGAEMGGEEEGAPRSRPQLSPSGAVEASSWMDP